MIPLAIILLLFAPLTANPPVEWEWRWSNPQPTGNNLIKVFFSDSLRGVLVADNRETVVTADGGETWTRETTGSNDDFAYGVVWIGRDTAVIVSDWVHYPGPFLEPWPRGFPPWGCKRE